MGDRSGSFYDGRCDTMGTLAQIITTPPLPVISVQPMTQPTVLSVTDVLAGNIGFSDDKLTSE